MEREQEEMQFLGLFDIYLESCKIIFRWKKIFTQITLSLILPLSFIFLAHEEVSEILYWRIRRTEHRLRWTKTGTPKYEKLSDLASSEWAYYMIFRAVYFTFLLIFSLLCTSAVVYTVACIYTAREITFKKVMSVVPKVWKRLMVTFLCTFFTWFAYNIIFVLTLILWGATIADSTAGAVIFMILLILYLIGFVYMTIIWQLASVVTVLEDSYGFKAMLKSKDLIKGKMFITIIIFFMLNFTLVIINFVFKAYVVYGWRVGVLKKIGFGVLCLGLLLNLILFGLIIQTVIYFVCKSYHHENIDKSALSDHLEVYLGDYVPLKAKDVQLEEYHVQL
ncbi:unnamed protein product [Fraxinus pennsylvanica]|uniref:Uncharacterized protein n=1 Tax=Fraxinus pennsylvanica TaxID=56036 RepID=A0AAD2A325_9LAMI|nr:unnamed protein product [Fraxinus pennsylvanica]